MLARYIAKRFAQLVLVLFLISLMIFSIMPVKPGLFFSPNYASMNLRTLDGAARALRELGLHR